MFCVFLSDDSVKSPASLTHFHQNKGTGRLNRSLGSATWCCYLRTQ